MNIIRKTETLTPNDLYSMTKGNNVRKMADAKGETLEVAKFVLYEDTNTDGEIMEVLAFETMDGTRYATNSRTFIRNFKDIVSIYDDAQAALPTKFVVGSGRSKSNREYLTCDLA